MTPGDDIRRRFHVPIEERRYQVQEASIALSVAIACAGLAIIGWAVLW